MRKLAVLALSAALVMGTMTGCGSTNSDAKNSDNAGTNKSASSETGFDTSKDISVVSREDGSGTRGAFIELTGVEEKDADGNKVDSFFPTRFVVFLIKFFNNVHFRFKSSSHFFHKIPLYYKCS